jgi:hypothetical protein
MKKNLLNYSNALLLLITIFMSSCATLYTGNKSIIHFSSNPENAEVSINDKLVGVTPLTIKIKRSLKKKTVTLKKSGYATKTFKLDKKFKAISLLSNVLIPIDAISGAIVDYPNHFYHQNLKLKDSINEVKPNYNINDNFYVISNSDTTFTNPFQELHHKSIFSDKIDVVKFKLLDGTEHSVPAPNVLRYKTLGIYTKGIGAFFLYCQTSQDYMVKIYISALINYNEKKNKKTYMFMEELLRNKEFHLVKSFEDITSMNAINGDMISTSKAIYYLYHEGEVVKEVEQDDLYELVASTFNNYKDLMELLKKKTKFKTLETYVYKDKRRADTQWFPY